MGRLASSEERVVLGYNNNRNLDPVVMDNLQTMLLDSHLYIGHYCHAYELIREKPVEEQEEITIRLYVNLQ